MTLDVAQSAALLIIAFLAIAILLRILVVVHRQNNTVKQLELRMKAMEHMEANPEAFAESITDTKKGE